MIIRSTRQEKREVTRTRLRQSAREVFATQGVTSASVDRISEEAGLSRGAFYSNYDTKEDLLLELMAEWLEQEAGAWQGLIDESADVEAVLQGFLARFRRASVDSDRGMLLMELALHAERNEEFAAHYQRFITAHHEQLAQMLSMLFSKAGKLPPAPPLVLAASVLSFGAALSLPKGHGAAEGDPTYAGNMFLLHLRGLLAIAEPADGNASRPKRTVSLVRSTR